MPGENAPETVPHGPISVVVTSLPERPPKALFKDSTRLLSVAAFIFSLATGLYAAYQTWRTDRLTTLETVSKLIDQYYLGQEKLATLNPATQLAYINLLRSELKAVASRAAQNAAHIQRDIDEGTWLALAQINQNESNWKTSTAAWNAAVQSTNEDYVYAFALRGLATVQVLQGKLDEADHTMELAFKSEASNDVQVKGISNRMSAAYRSADAAATQGYYLNLFRRWDCPFISQHFDSARAMAAQAREQGVPDPALVNQLLGVKLGLERFRQRRASCEPVDEAFELSNDTCYLLDLILDSAPIGYGPLRGPVDKNLQSSPLVLSLPQSNGCSTDSASLLTCGWPETDESGTKQRTESLIQTISNCRNLAPLTKSENHSNSSTLTADVTTLHPTGRPDVSIVRWFEKPTSSLPSGRWNMMLNIRP
jgi:hypothetical protein